MSKQIDLHVLQFYQAKKLLGSGAYGHVWKVIDKKTKRIFALKKIFDAFQNSTDAQRTYRQISFLHQIQHKNIVKLYKVIKAKNKKDLYLVFQFVQSDLHSLVGQQILTPTHIKFIIFQILKALKYVHSAHLIHRDLKPSNVLINSDCQIKLCDFGLARSLVHQQQQQNILSEEVATRWYRSPEMLLGSKQYSKPTDIWSIGCITAELVMGEPIFQGNSTLNQLQKIIQFTGIPSKYTIDSLRSEMAENIINSLSVKRKSLKQYFRRNFKQNQQLINLTLSMLEFNPSKRPTIQELLKNKIFHQFQFNTNQEQQICQKFIVLQIDDNQKLKLQQYRKLIYKDIQRRYPQFNDEAMIKSLNEATIKSSNEANKDEKKHKSLIQKVRKRSIQKNPSFHNQSIIYNKSLPKTRQNTPTGMSNKKSVLRRQARTEVLQNNQNNEGYLKQKFMKIDRKINRQDQQKVALIQTCKAQPNRVQAVKQIAKPRDLKNEKGENKGSEINQCKQNKKKEARKVKQMKRQQKRDIAGYNKVQQKGGVYKEQLKRMKSKKNLTKQRRSKPKFEKSITRLN